MSKGRENNCRIPIAFRCTYFISSRESFFLVAGHVKKGCWESDNPTFSKRIMMILIIVFPSLLINVWFSPKHKKCEMEWLFFVVLFLLILNRWFMFLYRASCCLFMLLEGGIILWRWNFHLVQNSLFHSSRHTKTSTSSKILLWQKRINTHYLIANILLTHLKFLRTSSSFL